MSVQSELDLPTRVAALEAAVAELRAGVVRGPDAGVVRVPGEWARVIRTDRPALEPRHGQTVVLGCPREAGEGCDYPGCDCADLLGDSPVEKPPLSPMSPEPWTAVAARAHQALAEAAEQVADASVLMACHRATDPEPCGFPACECGPGAAGARQDGAEAGGTASSGGGEAVGASGALLGAARGMSSDEPIDDDDDPITRLSRALLSERANAALMQSRLEDASAAVQRHVRRVAELHEALAEVLAICADTHPGDRAHAALSRIQGVVRVVLR